MPKRAAVLLLAVSAFMLFGEAPLPGSGQALSPGAEAVKLVSALKADSFQAAARLADKLLADPARIIPRGIRGAGGEQTVNMVNGIAISLGPLAFEQQTICEFPMDTLNAIGGRYLAGLLGNPLLWLYRVHMDFKNGRLILEERPKAPVGPEAAR